MKFLELESERLFYRKFNEDDFPVLFDWVSNEETMKYREGTSDESQARGYLNMLISNTNADDVTDCEYAVVRKSDNKLIGSGVLMHMPDNPEIGWTLHRDYWKQGYATEIGRTMLELGFGKLKYQRIISQCHIQNEASYKVMERLGMHRKAYLPKSGMKLAPGDEWYDEVQYVILREEWVAEKQHIK